MRQVHLRIDRVAVEITEEVRVGELEETLRKALALLAARLADLPVGAAKEAPRHALDMLEVGPVDPDWLSGPAAAAVLADALYARIVGGTR